MPITFRTVILKWGAISDLDLVQGDLLKRILSRKSHLSAKISRESLIKRMYRRLPDGNTCVRYIDDFDKCVVPTISRASGSLGIHALIIYSRQYFTVLLCVVFQQYSSSITVASDPITPCCYNEC